MLGTSEPFDSELLAGGLSAAGPHVAVKGYSVDQVTVRLSTELTERLRELARQQDMTLFAPLLSGWAVLLGRWSRQEEVSIGIQIQNRPTPTEPQIDAFESTAALQIRLQEDATSEELFKEVATFVEEFSAHEDVSFEGIAEALDNVGSRRRPFRIPTVFSAAPVTIIVSTETGLSCLKPGKMIEGEKLHSELRLSLSEGEECLTGTLKYASDLFEREAIERMTACWEVLLEGMVADVQQPIGRLPILSAAERQQVLHVFNDTTVVYPEDRLIHELFEAQVQRAPNAIAVLYEQQSLTYTELNGRANQLACYLRSKGVGPDQIVGMCVERSLEMVVGLLAILKAGGAYLPLDPNYPVARLAYMLKDACPRVLLTEERLRSRLPTTANHVITLDSGWSEIVGLKKEDLEPHLLELTSDHLAYVIYTSGSTGEPKGVAAEHRGMVNRITAQELIGAFSADDICCQKTSIGFVDAIFEILGPLSYGRPLVIAPAAAAKDVQQLASLIEREHITRLVTVPSLAQSLVEDVRSMQSLRSLRNWTLSGEKLKGELLRKLKRWLPKCTFTNLYGSSEVAADATYYVSMSSTDNRVPIGRPIANTQIYILDRHLEPVPIGMAGEIYIGGAGVARGYINRPELTAESFIADPFRPSPKARLYRSGDLGWWRADGAIEYMGRIDHQVKVRGFRIELEEIEAQLARHAKVKEVAVIAREDVPGDMRVVAYITIYAHSTVDAEELRVYLNVNLPNYMIPSAFVILESLPLTASGKLNRRALPVPERSAYATRQYEAPQGDMEEMLAGIWRELLRLQTIGRWDNFFELGGHSLQIVQMLERLRQIGISIEVRRVFESPTLADLASDLTKKAGDELEVPPNLIPAHSRAITPQMLPLVELEPNHIERIVESITGGAENIQDIYPLVPLQEGILFHHLVDEKSASTYIVSTLLSMRSRERLQELTEALQRVIDRHDVLRTAVLWEQLPRPVQVVYRRATLSVEEITLIWDRNRDPPEQIEEWITSEPQRMDLRQAPLMRLRVAADTHRGLWYALLQLHHIVDDDTSLKMLISEVVAHLQGRAEELPEPVPYRRHVAQALAHARTYDAAAFFHSKLKDIDEPTAPFGLLNVYGAGGRINEAFKGLEAELVQRVRAQARHYRVSVATLFHAAWSLVVARTTGRDDVVFGSVLLGRLQGSAGAQQILGMFINTLPLRVTLQDITAKELVEQTQQELVELLSHEQASLALAQRCSGIVGSAPLFTSLLNYRHNAPGLKVEWADASEIRAISCKERTNYPIMVLVDDLGVGLTLKVQTDHRIDPHRITGYLHTAVRSLVGALENAPQIPALKLEILPESERHQIIESFNDTRTAYAREKLIHELFEEQVKRTPDAVAVAHEGKSFTYSELNGKANQLAWYLRGSGIGPEQLVGICLERSLHMVVGLLGILKAGGAYVPLDPNFPAERLDYTLANASPRVLLTQEHLRQRLPATTAEIVALDSDWSRIAQQSVSNLDARMLGLCSRHLAYVIYTSGSTGQPKGAMNEHQALINRLQWMQNQYRLSCSDRVLQKTPFSFDVSVWEFFWPMMSGARLIVARPQGHQDPVYLRNLIEETGITTLHFVPSMLQIFLDQHQVGDCMTLRHIICSGEELSPALKNKCLECLPHARLSNLYGPTEAAIDVTAWECRLDEDSSRVPIGRPISNIQMYVLNRYDQPVPIGVVGEIYIGGVGVARGYLNQPELTAERFLPDPFSTDSQARVYRTGDLGRWRADGAIEYLGRNDHQVKIRGFRIELGEIEVQLIRHKHIKDAVVIAREDVPGEKRLVAYVTRRQQSAPDIEELRAHLRTALPDYMVPSAFVILESMPLTPNGKLDRRTLPVPELSAYASQDYEAPQGEIEEAISRIWRELLRVERVGRQDNFFDLGGNSLLATRVVTHISHALDIDLSMRVIFEKPTIQALSNFILLEIAAEVSMENL